MVPHVSIVCGILGSAQRWTRFPDRYIPDADARFKTLKKAQRLGDPNLWAEYRELRNTVTNEVRLSKSKYYLELFNKVKDCKSFWRPVRNATNGKLILPILGIRNADGKVATSDLDKANILNEHSQLLAKNWPTNCQIAT